MKELEPGVFDLELNVPCDIPDEAAEQLLDAYGEGIERGIAAVILGNSSRYRKWVGVSFSTILASLVNFVGAQRGLAPGDKEKVNELKVAIVGDAIPIIEQARRGTCAWLRAVGHSSFGEDDAVLALVVNEVGRPAGSQKKVVLISAAEKLLCPSCKGVLPPLMHTRFCLYCGKPVPAGIQLKQAMSRASNEAAMEEMGMARHPKCSDKVHADKAAFARKYVSFLERAGRAAKKRGSLTHGKLFRIWQETMGTQLPFHFSGSRKKRLTEAETKEFVSQNIVRFCNDCGIRLAGM